MRTLLLCLVLLVAAVPATAAAPKRAAAKARPAATAWHPAVPFIEDDFGRALALAKARRLPVFIEGWAPW